MITADVESPPPVTADVTLNWISALATYRAK